MPCPIQCVWDRITLRATTTAVLTFSSIPFYMVSSILHPSVLQTPHNRTPQGNHNHVVDILMRYGAKLGMEPVMLVRGGGRSTHIRRCMHFTRSMPPAATCTAPAQCAWTAQRAQHARCTQHTRHPHPAISHSTGSMHSARSTQSSHRSQSKHVIRSNTRACNRWQCVSSRPCAPPRLDDYLTLA